MTDNSGITGQTHDIAPELDLLDDEPTEELEAVRDPDDGDFSNDRDVVLTDEWP